MIQPSVIESPKAMMRTFFVALLSPRSCGGSSFKFLAVVSHGARATKHMVRRCRIADLFYSEETRRAVYTTFVEKVLLSMANLLP